MLEPTDIVNVYLRRYSRNDDAQHSSHAGYSYHNAKILIAKEKAVYETKSYSEGGQLYTSRIDPYLDHYRGLYPNSHSYWPVKCDWCNYKFSEDDEWQIYTDLLWCRKDTGQLVTIKDTNKLEGAMYYAWWKKDSPRYAPAGPLYAICPGGHPWNIDGRASNCGKPDDNVHRCWIRHGEPPDITVDKNGNTCSAGAGSIQAGNYHGFLRNGYFTDG